MDVCISSDIQWLWPISIAFVMIVNLALVPFSFPRFNMLTNCRYALLHLCLKYTQDLVTVASVGSTAKVSNVGWQGRCFDNARLEDMKVVEQRTWAL